MTASDLDAEEGGRRRLISAGAGVRIAAVALLLAVGSGVLLVGRSIHTQPQLRLRGPVAPVNESALDPLDIRPTTPRWWSSNPVSPSNLIVANRVDIASFPGATCSSGHARNSFQTQQRQSMAVMTTDGGRTWAQINLRR